MRKILVPLFCLFALLQTKLFSQEVGPSSSSPDSSFGKENTWHFEFYFSPTISFNLGNKKNPPGYNASEIVFGGDYSESYSNTKEYGGFGYCLGIETKARFYRTNFFIGTGISFELFHYTGTTTVTSYYNSHLQYPPPPTVIKKFQQDYSYTDMFIDIPLIIYYSISERRSNRLNVLSGVSGGRFLSENNTGYTNYSEYYNYQDKTQGEKYTFTLFGIVGLEYNIKVSKTTSLTIEPLFTCQINNSPTGRRFASAGIKFGILF